jgi:uncharacterized protein (DUF2141 family)
MSGNFGCASIVPPVGGPKDTIAPQLLKASPKDSTLNFHNKEIELTFDEYVDLKDIQTNLLFTPTFGTNPEIKARAKTLTIRFRDSLESNTTYVLNFGNAIVDINEGNVLKNFVYTFSTGAALDSLEINGRVLLAETGGIDSTLIVVLHRRLADSAVRTDRPQYVVRLNQNGAFHFRYLPSDTFAVYALGNAALSKKYQDVKQLFAFSNTPVIAGKADSILLYAYNETPTTNNVNPNIPSLPGRTNSANDRRLRFNANSAQQDLLTDYIISFPVPLRNFDSTKIQLTTDSSFNSTSYSVQLDSAKKELRFKTAWKENTKYNLVLQKDFAADTSGKQLLKTDTLFFITKKRSDYGNISIRVKNLDASKNPVLQFVQNNQVVFSTSIKSGSFSQQLFPPGEYSFRILYDANGNGKWDPGKFFGEKRQPEIVKPLEGTKTVKAAWDNEFDIVF